MIPITFSPVVGLLAPLFLDFRLAFLKIFLSLRSSSPRRNPGYEIGIPDKIQVNPLTLPLSPENGGEGGVRGKDKEQIPILSGYQIERLFSLSRFELSEIQGASQRPSGPSK
jgi:hypothetical protein